VSNWRDNHDGRTPEERGTARTQLFPAAQPEGSPTFTPDATAAHRAQAQRTIFAWPTGDKPALPFPPAPQQPSPAPAPRLDHLPFDDAPPPTQALPSWEKLPLAATLHGNCDVPLRRAVDKTLDDQGLSSPVWGEGRSWRPVGDSPQPAIQTPQTAIQTPQPAIQRSLPPAMQKSLPPAIQIFRRPQAAVPSSPQHPINPWGQRFTLSCDTPPQRDALPFAPTVRAPQPSTAGFREPAEPAQGSQLQSAPAAPLLETLDQRMGSGAPALPFNPAPEPPARVAPRTPFTRPKDDGLGAAILGGRRHP
jgi:hypothetical protein